mmetsp:Transcript_18716/g.40526  ORF Transcript_18716/g.40526 Transcript_18716/m.40526 type:complete len:95 (+) Transcript_18716:1006-1290(+)
MPALSQLISGADDGLLGNVSTYSFPTSEHPDVTAVSSHMYRATGTELDGSADGRTGTGAVAADDEEALGALLVHVLASFSTSSSRTAVHVDPSP